MQKSFKRVYWGFTSALQKKWKRGDNLLTDSTWHRPSLVYQFRWRQFVLCYFILNIINNLLLQECVFLKLFFLCLQNGDSPRFSSCYCTQKETWKFAEESKSIGVYYAWLTMFCCRNVFHFLREIAAVYKKLAPALKYSSEM